MNINVKVFYVTSSGGDSQACPMYPKYVCNIFAISQERRDGKLIFGMQINIKLFYKLTLSIFVGMANHAQGT